MDEQELDLLAARAAVACWFGKEGQLAAKLQCSDLDEPLLRKWLATWMLSRSVPMERREKLRSFLRETVRPALLGASRSSEYELVDELSQQARASGILNGRPTSLISKFAFSLRPEIFTPYDRRARIALRRAGHQVRPHDYAAYMRAFDAESDKVLRRLSDAGVFAARLNYQGHLMPKRFSECVPRISA